ncbi:hypothetical protein C453_14583, partial [Haloferax elongans ATCC BAA-1513]
MTTALVTGTDPEGLGEALESEGATIVRITGMVSADSLGEAGIEEADLLVLTDICLLYTSLS